MKMRKILNGVLACTMALSMVSVVSAAENDIFYDGAYEPLNANFYIQEDSLTLEEIALMSDEELQELELAPLELNGARVNTSYLTSKNYLCQQIENTYCGPATTLQMLKIAGTSHKISGSTDNEKQETLAKRLGTKASNGTWIVDITKELNHFAPRGRSWKNMTVNPSDSSTLSSMQYFARSNHLFEHAVNYLLFPSTLSYYPSTSNTGHYISGSGIQYLTNNSNDYKNIRLRINDPHYNSKYFGIRYENFLNVAHGMYNYSKARGPANFVY